ncbi:MAG TPA: DUF1801 domain-containing protein [Meiothermus sp.]|nr:DUF1801 domain-containing protein [Meiothermus sp.]
MSAPQPSILDQLFAPLPQAQRAALERLRGIVKSVAPDAEECTSYGLPAFKLGKKKLVAFGAWKDHCSFYPMSARVLAAFAQELAGYGISKGTIRFRPDQPLPESLVRQIVEARLEEISSPKPAASLKSPRPPSAR